MPRIYRALLIGTGSIADAHVRAAADCGRVQIVAAAELDEVRGREFAARHGIPAVYRDYREALATVRPDFAFIASPPALHAEMAIAAMRAGAWAWCEKPLCASLAEFDQISAAEAETGNYTACVFQMRFASSTTHLRRLVAQGTLGSPLVAVCHTLWYRDLAYYQVPWRGRWATELGGPTMGQGIHAMDHLLHLWGEWDEVWAQVATLDRAIEVEDVSMAIVRFAHGGMASIVNSVLSPRQETYLRLDYQRGTVELTHLYAYTGKNWRFTPAAPADAADLTSAWEQAPADEGSTHAAQLTALVTSRDQGVQPATSGDRARQTWELVAAIYRSAQTGRSVRRGEIAPGDPFYERMSGQLRAP